MSIAELYSNGVWSTVKYNGAPITDRFYTTVANQELIKFLDITGTKYVSTNSVYIEAGLQDLYFTPVRRVENPDAYVFTNEPVLFCAANESITITGVEIIGLKMSNSSGAKIFCMATRY